jgi:catechol 2,3-dioxygenase-like lactoylglutathione lyase family enzyme
VSDTGAVGRILSVVVDCRDPDVSSRFWQQLLGYERLYDDVAEQGTEWVTIGRPDDDRDRLSFQRVADHQPPTWPTGPRPQQLHLDLRVEDLEAADQQVLAAGAQPLGETVVHPDEMFRVYADPDGHPFCLVQRRLAD